MSNHNQDWAARLEQLTPFQLARIKLTLWYFLGFSVLVAFFTYLTFDAKQSAYFRVYQVVGQNASGTPQVVELNNKFDEFNKRFQQRVLLFDAGILIAATFASYFLSGKTLEPIQRMMEEQASFAADVSHSLRTPLTTMNLEIGAYLKTHKAAPHTKALLTSVKEEILHMAHITQGLLTLVRSQNQTINPQNETVDITDLVRKTSESMRAIIINHQQSLTIGSLPKATVKGNLDQLKQVIFILLENAVKYTNPHGSITVSLTTSARRVIITITDTGQGIAKEEIPLITQRFYRASNHKTIKGTGLGLSIAQKIIAAHKGTFTIKSKLGKGTSCLVNLPRHT